MEMDNNILRNEQTATRQTAKHRLQYIEFKDGHWSDYALPNSRPADYIAYSMLGRVTIHNNLPAAIVEAAACVP